MRSGSVFVPDCRRTVNPLWRSTESAPGSVDLRRPSRFAFMPGMSDNAFPFPVLVCDTGGTNVRFALQSDAGGPLGPIVHLITDDYPGLPEAIEAAIAEARDAAALDDRLRRRAGGRPDAQAHQCALGDGRAGDGAPRRPRPGAAAQRLRGAGPVAAGDPRGLDAPDRPAPLRRQGAAGDPRPRHRARRSRRWSRRTGASPRCRRRPATSISGRSGRKSFALWPHLERAHGRITSESVLNGAGPRPASIGRG